MANRALLVGINKYKMANSDLSGCVNDVTNVRDSLLKFFGFKIDDIRVVTDERATKKAIMERLTGWSRGPRPGTGCCSISPGMGPRSGTGTATN